METTTTSADRQLLLAVLALRDDLIDTRLFSDLCARAALDPTRSLAELLVEHGVAPEDRDALLRKLERKLARHRGDPRLTLGAEATAEVRTVLRSVAPDALRETEAILPPVTRHSIAETVVAPAESSAAETVVVDSGRLVREELIPRSDSEHPNRYTLTRVHAQGGLGKVWIARDTDLNREVALKEIRPDRADNPEAWRRFLKEAQVTGQLEHPGIVPVYELARRDQDDQPFYTMRLVRGRNLREVIAELHKQHADRGISRLELQRNLLEPFLKLCEAVSYAHSRGVLHRDLKPENVVLGTHGEVILLDWGLAKMIGQPDDDSTEAPVRLTEDAETSRTVSAVGTPAYMAPEQVEADASRIDTRTDIYGLGGILYEMLTGRPPAGGKSLDEVFRNILQGKIDPPRSLVPTVPPALQAICLKALAREPDDRYPSAAALAEDVRRWIADEPVSVFRDPLLVRLLRGARRHRTLVATVAALTLTSLIALATGLVLINQERERTDIQRRRAETSTALALENLRIAQGGADRLLSGVALIEVAEIPLMESVRRRLLEEARGNYEHFLAQKGDDPIVRWGIGRSLVRLGDIDTLLGQLQPAEQSFRKGMGYLDELARNHPDNSDYKRDLAAAHRGLGILLKESGRDQEAEDHLRQAVDLLTRLPTEADRRELADTRYQLAALLARQPDRPADPNLYRAALEDLERLEHDAGSHPELQSRSIRYRNNEARLLTALGMRREAEARLREILDDFGPRINEPESLPGLRWQWARAAANLGALIHDDRPDEAASWYDQAIDKFRTLVAEFPRIPQYRAELADALYNRSLLAREDDPASALPLLRKALDLLDALVSEAPGIPNHRIRRARVRIELNTLLAETDPEAAEIQLRGSLADLQSVVDAYPSSIEYMSALGRAHYQLARFLVSQERYAEAAAEAAAASQLHRQVLSSRPRSELERSHLYEALSLQSFAYLNAGEPAEAAAAADALSDTLKNQPEAQLQAAAIHVRLAEVDPERASQHLDRAVQILTDAVRREVIISPADLDLDALEPLRTRSDFLRLRRQLAPDTLPDLAPAASG
ncbi:MAG: hypothetical protein KatS3mg108_0809 [Isosphaeraceae bacterium]|jgi:serine/threonine-protein kinase|nr:MAG: hypothetical protein KatS3mg108_0809 [Isosphaeraceae bacterium]